MVDRFTRDELAGSGEDLESDGKHASKFATLTFAEHARLGLPLMLVFLSVSTAYIIMIYRW